MKSVALGGPKVRESRFGFSDPTDGGDVWPCRDCSIAPIFNHKRRLKSVLDVLDGIDGDGVFSLKIDVWNLEPSGTRCSPIVWLFAWCLETLVQRPGDGDLGFSRNIFAISMPNSGEEGCIRLLLGAEMLQSGAGEIAFRKNLVVAPSYDLILFFHHLFFVVILRLLLVALVF